MDLKQRRLEILRLVETGELDLASASSQLRVLDALAMDEQDAAEIEIVEGMVPGEDVVEQPVPVPVEKAPMVQPVQALEPVTQPEQGDTDEAQPGSNTGETPPSTGWRGLWVLPFLFGIFLTLGAASWMVQGYQAAGLSWGFWFSLIPFAIGIFLLWAGWEMRVARWLNVRIRQAPGKRPQTIAFGIPLPLGLTRWVIQRSGGFTKVRGQDISEFVEQMDQAVSTDGPMHIFVNDDEDGEQVEIWIEGPRS